MTSALFATFKFSACSSASGWLDSNFSKIWLVTKLEWSKSCKLQGGVNVEQKLPITIDNMGDLDMELNKLGFRQCWE